MVSLRFLLLFLCIGFSAMAAPPTLRVQGARDFSTLESASLKEGNSFLCIREGETRIGDWALRLEAGAAGLYRDRNSLFLFEGMIFVRPLVDDPVTLRLFNLRGELLLTGPAKVLVERHSIRFYLSEQSGDSAAIIDGMRFFPGGGKLFVSSSPERHVLLEPPEEGISDSAFELWDSERLIQACRVLNDSSANSTLRPELLQQLVRPNFGDSLRWRLRQQGLSASEAN